MCDLCKKLDNKHIVRIYTAKENTSSRDITRKKTKYFHFICQFNTHSFSLCGKCNNILVNIKALSNALRYVAYITLLVPLFLDPEIFWFYFICFMIGSSELFNSLGVSYWKSPVKPFFIVMTLIGVIIVYFGIAESMGPFKYIDLYVVFVSPPAFYFYASLVDLFSPESEMKKKAKMERERNGKLIMPIDNAMYVCFNQEEYEFVLKTNQPK